MREDREDSAVRGTKGRSPRAGADANAGAFRGGGAHSLPPRLILHAVVDQPVISSFCPFLGR